MKAKVFFMLTLAGVLSIYNIASAQTPSQQEEVILTTYYPAPYGDYVELTISGNANSPALDVTPTLTATANGDSLTALHINPVFNDGGFSNVRHNGLIVESGNVGIGTTNPQARLDVAGAILIAPTAQPASPQPGMIYYDQTSNVMRYYKGGSSPGWVDIGVDATAWTPVALSLGSLPTGTGVQQYTIPAAIPATAREILVYAWYSHGDGGIPQTPASYTVYTSTGTASYAQRFQTAGGHWQTGWWDGSSLCGWFPVVQSNRILYVRRSAATGGNILSGLMILGYR